MSTEELLKEVAELKAALKEREKTIETLIEQLAAKQASQEGTGSAHCVDNPADLYEALTCGVPRVALKAGTVFDLGLFDCPIDITQQCESELVGNGSTLLGHLRVKSGVHLTLTDVIIQASVSNRPCLEVQGANAQVSMVGCTVVGGRDGVMLSGGASCSATKCCFKDNSRGVFESFRCTFKATRCEFVNNYFHMVLLSQPKHTERAHSVMESGHTFVGERTLGDIALSYNPVIDSYGEVYKDGSVRVLTPTQNTTNLVDPSW